MKHVSGIVQNTQVTSKLSQHS